MFERVNQLAVNIHIYIYIYYLRLVLGHSSRPRSLLTAGNETSRDWSAEAVQLRVVSSGSQ